MKDAKLKLADREIDIKSEVTTIGRTSDNSVSFTEDSNISRFHAEIERRGEDYYLIDLKSSNGTSVNGQKLEGETRLESGDKLLFGGSSEAKFVIGEMAPIGEAEAVKKDGSGSTGSEGPAAGGPAGGGVTESVGD